MSSRTCRVALCLVAFAMAFGSLLPHAVPSLSHGPVALAAAKAESHAQRDAEFAEHGHSHDDDARDERIAGHSHGHNSADHSHETPTTPPGNAPVVPARVRSWMPMPPRTAHIGAIYRLDRPPRPIVIA